MEEARQFVGRVYKLVSSETDQIYIGSTTLALSERLRRHKVHYNIVIKGEIKNVTSAVEILKYDDVTIELVYEGEFRSKQDLRKQEGCIIKNTVNCVNKIVAGRTSEEYRQDNKQILNQRSREYYGTHKELLGQKNKEYRKANQEALKEYMKSYREVNANQIKEKAKQQREANPEHFKEKDQRYYEMNKQKVLQRMKEKITCPVCGSVISKGDKAKHERTNKHKKSNNYLMTIR
jgi:hypothetical protein